MFLMSQCPSALEEIIKNQGCDVVRSDVEPGSPADLQMTVDTARAEQVRAVVLDGHRFTYQFQASVKSADLAVVVLTDYVPSECYDADVLWNADLPIRKEMYSGSVNNLLLGPAYALLRRQFVDFQVNPRVPATIGRNVLVSMGGSDPQHVTEPIVGALGGKDALHVRVILGSSNANRTEICEDKDQCANVEYLSDVKDMPIHMDWADLAIVAPGVALWELLFMGVPTLCWPRYPEDFELVCELERAGAVIVLPRDLDPARIGLLVDELANDHSRRQRMSNVGRQLVDGRGAARVASAIVQVARANARSEKARAH